MMMKPMTLTASALLALMITGPAWTAETVKQQTTDKAKDQATEAVKGVIK